jgi:dolichyl-diphosphooligosaccharide--protein glycosyltransferase
LQSLQSVTDEKEAVMASWWDYGYSSLLFNKLPVLADGGSQVSPPTYMMAKALLAPSLQETAAILRFLAREGGSGIAAHADSQKTLFDHIASSAAAPAPPIYFMLTNQMTGWINSISKIGNWNLDTGQPVPVRGNLGGPGLNYNMLQCKPMAVRHQLNCNGHIFDLRSGQVDGKLRLDGAVQTRNGQQVGGVNFPGQQVNMFQLAEIDQEQIAYLLHRDLFQSSFNQLFHLGRADNSLFEMIYDDYPHARIFRLQSQ